MFDTKAYVLFTMDKLINALVRQLQNFVGDETSTKCIDLFNKYFEQRTNGNETGDDAARTDQEYCATAEKVGESDRPNIDKFIGLVARTPQRKNKFL